MSQIIDPLMVGGPGAPSTSKPPKPKKQSAKSKLDKVKLANAKRRKEAAAELAAVHLSLSHLKQNELLTEDIDIDMFKLKIGKTIGVDISECLTAASVERTIEGASTLTVTLLDRDRKLLQSSRLHNRNDTEIDGLYFRLAKVEKQGEYLTLTFEDREVAVLRRYSKPIKPNNKNVRDKITRAQFIRRLVKEPREYKPKGIPCVIPDLKVVQPVAVDTSADTSGFGTDDASTKGVKQGAVTVKGATADASQTKIINTILNTGQSMVLRRDILVMAIMCATQESTMRNLDYGLPGAYNHLSDNNAYNPVGVFQQIKAYGWAASRDVAKDAESFYRHAVKIYVKGKSLGDMVEEVQRSGNPKGYKQWYNEANKTVTAWGLQGTDEGSKDLKAELAKYMGSAANGSSGGPFHFYRGVQPVNKGGPWKPETSWDCIQRLAGDVNWRAFMVSGVFYYLPEDELYKQKPRAILSEDSKGVLAIDFDFDVGKNKADVTITCHMGRWDCPPGSVLMLKEMGIVSGRWLVETVTRDLYRTDGTITLSKPLPALPEPAKDDVSQTSGDFQFNGFKKDDSSNDTGKQFKIGTGLIHPIPKAYSQGAGGIHETGGLAGYPAIDDFAKPGSPVVAPMNGKIVRFSGHDPLLGAIEGAGGPLGWSIYLLNPQTGTEFYMTHLDKRLCTVGQTVRAGQQIATVANYDKFGRQSHVHIGVHPGPSGHPDVHDLINSPRAVGGK